MKNHIIAFDDHTNFYPLESELIKISEEKKAVLCSSCTKSEN